MADSIPAAPGRIFMSYRRQETAYPAGWLYDRLADHFGGGQVFKDVDSIELGDDFVEVITRAVGSCDVLLALIGDEWLTITDEHGQRRLDDPDDFVRLEIEAALTRNVRVIPILVDGARMPRAAELPASLARLVRRQALELSPARFDFDTSRLLKVLDRTLVELRTAQDDAASIRVPAEEAPDPGTTEVQEASERREQTEPSPTPSIPPVTPATPPAARPAADQSKPPDRRTREVQEASERREQTKPSPTPSISPAAPATPVRPLPSDPGKPPGKQRRRLSTRTRVLAGAGVGVVLILLIVAIVANRDTTSTETVIFQDDFSSQASGWTNAGSKLAGGHYKNDAYRIYVEDGHAEGAPESASKVFPSAPPSLIIEVETRRIAGSSQDAQYGILCRATEADSFYAFIVKNESVTILKHTNSGDHTLASADTSPGAVADTNQLSANCDGDAEQTYVYLALLVNGKKVAEVTDESPLPAGTVGLFAATDTKKAVEVEFDNFVVKQV